MYFALIRIVGQYCAPLICAMLSARILVYCHRDPKLSLLAWIALVPFMICLPKKGIWLTLLMSTVFGLVYLHGIFSWILDVQGYRFYHHMLIAIPFGAYFICFGLSFKLISSRLNHHLAFLAIPFIWVTLEYLRSNFLFLALPLGLIGHTQYLNHTIIQIANIGGAYMVSFVVVLVNAAIADVAVALIANRQKRFPGSKQKWTPISKVSKPLLVSAVCAMTSTTLYGLWNVTQKESGQPVKVALIQGNIAQEKKWDPKYMDSIMDTFTRLTLKSSASKPDLIIWPETAIPGDGLHDQNHLLSVKELSINTESPILVGSALGNKFDRQNSRNREYRNSALLVTSHPDMIVDQHYDKMKLFPFAEYLPHGKYLPWQILRISPASRYRAGETYTIFKLPAFTFATLICWETLFPDLCREFAIRGAQFIANISNEARFGKSEAPYLILAANVFRAVENGIHVVRCANTGISCIIDASGRIVHRVRNATGDDIFVQGTLVGTVVAKNTFSFYTRHGDIFAMGCAVATLVVVLWAIIIYSFHIKHPSVNP
jgi:apolipoprotein N-acyltransferase